MTTTVDPDLMLQLLRTLEANLDERGWDGEPPSLSALYDQTDTETAQIFDGAFGMLSGTTAYAERYASRPCYPIMTIDPNGARALFAHSVALAAGGRDYPSLAILRKRGFLGVVFAFEAWMGLVHGTDIERRAYSHPDDRAPLEDLPDVIECRYLVAVDVDERLYTVTRIKGQEPQGRRTSRLGDQKAEEPKICGGCVPESLQRVVAAVMDRAVIPATFLPAQWEMASELPKADLAETVDA